MTDRRRTWAFRITLIAVGTFSGLAIAEFLIRWSDLAPAVQTVRLHDPNSPYRRSENATLRYELRPGFSSQLSAQHQYLRTTETEFLQQSSSAVTGTVTINSHGLRDKEREITRTGSGRRIVLLGDSVVEMVNYVSDEYTISRLLEQRFKDGTEVLNVGTAGYCTRAEVELLREKGLAFQPDVVVVVFVENDYWGYNLEHTVDSVQIRRPAVISRLFQHSDLFRITSLKLNLFGYADEFDPAAWHRRAIGSNNVVSGFRLLQQLAQDFDFEVVVAFWPSFFKEGIGYRYLLSETNDLVAEPIAWQFGFPTIRLDNAFRVHWSKLSPQPQPEWYYSCGDGMHPSIIGCQVAADMLYNSLKSKTGFSNVVVPESINGLVERFAKASRVAGQLALEPEASASLNEQVKMTLLRQNRSVDADRLAQSSSANDPEELNALLAAKSTPQESYLAAGREFLSANQLYAARDMFERAAVLDASNVEARIQLAHIYLQLGLQAKAASVLQQVLAVEPNDQDAAVLLKRIDPLPEDE